MRETAALVDEVLGWSSDSLPAEARNRAVVLLIDLLGAGLYGSRTVPARIVHDIAVRRGGAGPAVVWGRGTSLPAAAAALVNGTQAHAFELDDYHLGAKLHPGAVVVPAVLSAATMRRRSAEDLLAAIIVGYEVMVRVSLAADASNVRRRGWHLTGVAGPLGAAAAAGRVLGLDRRELLHALGIAGSFSSGLFAFSREGAMIKRLHAGRAAEGGILAAELALDGFTGPSEVLEAEDGGLLQAISDRGDPGRLVAGLGRRLAITEVAVKPYPCCGSLHSSVDVLLDLVGAHQVAADDIEEVAVFNAAVVGEQCGYVYSGAGGVLEAQMSMQYCLAVAAVDRRLSTDQFTQERRQDPEVLDLARRVTFRLDQDIDQAYPERFPARVRLGLRSGQVLEGCSDAPSGSPEHPYDVEAAATKFRDLSRGIMDGDAQTALLHTLRTFAQGGDVHRLLSGLRVQSGPGGVGEADGP